MPKIGSEFNLSKSMKSKRKQGLNSFKIEKNQLLLSPSISEISKNHKKSPDISYKTKSLKKKKRKRTTSDSSIAKSLVKLKKKKKNKFKKFPRLTFNESFDENSLCDGETPTEQNGSDQFVDPVISDDSDIDVLDKKIEGLRLQDIFKPATNEFMSDYQGLNIPKKHFNLCEDDLEPDKRIYEKDLNDENQFEPVKEICEQTSNVNNNKYEKYGKNNPNITDDVENETILSEDINNQDFKKKNLNNNFKNLTENGQDIADPYFEDQNLIKSIADTKETTNLNPESTSDFILNINLKTNDILVIINTFEKIYFYGLYTIEVLQGQLEILGAILNNRSGVKKVYSPRGSSLLYLQNYTIIEETKSINITDLVDKELLGEDDKVITVQNAAAVILCRKLEEPYIDFIEKHTAQVLFPVVESEGPRLVFSPSGAWNHVQTELSWTEVTDSTCQNSKIAICGGKGVGKSTFLRYTVNRLLQKFPKVRVVDLDSGQTEFTVPGCISIVCVTAELFGSNYTHHIPFDRAIICNINVGYDLKQYIKSVETLIEVLPNIEEIPTLFNLCGYHKGLGLNMTQQVINLIKPSQLVQIKSKNSNKNYIFDLTAENVKQTLRNCDWDLNYEFFMIRSGVDSQKSRTWTMEARFSREINILSYLGKLMSENVTNLTDHQINMYSKKLSSLKIKDSEGNIISPLTINANLVGLCSYMEESGLFLCHGWGFVRGLDPEADLLVLLTPENIETLEQVDHLVVTTNQMVPSLLMSTGEVRGQIPYIAEGPLLNLAQLTKRSYLPPKSNW